MSQISNVGISRKTLIEQTGAPLWVLNYLNANNALPVINPAKGRGFPVEYSQGAVNVVLEYLKTRTLAQSG